MMTPSPEQPRTVALLEVKGEGWPQETAMPSKHFKANRLLSGTAQPGLRHTMLTARSLLKGVSIFHDRHSRSKDSQHQEADTSFLPVPSMLLVFS